MVGTRPEVDLPPVALEMLDTVDQDRVFYSVSWRSPQGDTFMTGYDDLPRPADAPTGKTIFYDAQYRGERIRVAALFTAMPAHPPVVVVTQVAETVGGRTGLIRTILVHALGQQLLLLRPHILRSLSHARRKRHPVPSDGFVMPRHRRRARISCTRICPPI